VRTDGRPTVAPSLVPRMRIAVVSPSIDKRHGTERRVAEFISRLADQYELHIYSMRVEDIDLSRVVWHRIPRLPGPYLLTYLWWFIANHFWRRLDRSRGIVPDVVYSPGVNCLDADAVSVHILFNSFRESVHDALKLSQNSIVDWPRIIHRRLFYRLIAVLEPYVYGRNYVCIAAVSNRIAADLRRLYRPLSEVSVIHNGIDLDCFSPNIAPACAPPSVTRFPFETTNSFCSLLVMILETKA